MQHLRAAFPPIGSVRKRALLLSPHGLTRIGRSIIERGRPTERLMRAGQALREGIGGGLCPDVNVAETRCRRSSPTD